MMMTEYLVSVIVPAYNSEKYIGQCLESLVNQTLRDIEIVVVNDGSTDRTREIIQKYVKKYNNILFVDQENGGIAKARTAGFLASHGKYIGWVDNDDFVELDMFEKMYRKAQEEDSDYIYCDYDFFPQKTSFKEKWYKKYYGRVDWNFIERNTHPWNKLVRRDLCDRVNMADNLPIFSDSVYVGLLLHARKIICMEDVLYHYRVGHESVSGSYKGRLSYYKEVANRAKKQKKFLEGTIYKEQLEEYFDYRYIYALLQLCIVSTVNNSKINYTHAREELNKLDYSRNKYTMLVLKNNFGFLKAFIMKYLIPYNYLISSVICKAVFR